MSASGLTAYHVGGTDPLNTGKVGFDSPWVAPHYAAMAASVDVNAAAARVRSMRDQGLMPPLGGPAEAVPNPTDGSVARWHSMQGVLNGFFSAVGYYHAVAASEDLEDRVYLTNQTDAELRAALEDLFAP